METTRIECGDCGSPFDAKRKNAKYCQLCRAIRDFKFMTTWTKDCWVCSKEFAPAYRKDLMCAECDDLRRSYNVDGACVFCGEESVLWHEQAHICWPCVKNPELRSKVLHALLKKQRYLRENPRHLARQQAEAQPEPEEAPSI